MKAWDQRMGAAGYPLARVTSPEFCQSGRDRGAPIPPGPSVTWAERTAGEIRSRLPALAVEGRAEHERGYLKSDLHHLGVPVPAIRATVVAALRASPAPDHDAGVGLVVALWDGEPAVHEHRMAAAMVLGRIELDDGDLPLVERMLRTSKTWALVDTIAPRPLASLADAHPSVDRVVTGWAGDEDVWIRRSALLRHLVPLREGRGDLAAFGAVADPLLADREFFVRKAIGWVLREASKRDPDGVRAWVEPRRDRMAGLTYREATKHLP